VHHCKRGTEEAHELHLALQARTFHDCVEDLLSENCELLTPLQMGSLPHDEIHLIGERGGKGRAVTRSKPRSSCEGWHGSPPRQLRQKDAVEWSLNPSFCSLILGFLSRQREYRIYPSSLPWKCASLQPLAESPSESRPQCISSLCRVV
jgi:hypothetical protein